jgi:hypothetical protein
MSRGLGWQGHLFTIIGLTCAVLFAPTTMILLFGMMPTIAANVMDKSRQKSRAISVGMMNFAGCMPFLLELWMSSAPNSFDGALAIMLQPKTIIIIYTIAAAGYAIEAAVTGMVATVMMQRASFRLKAIEAQLTELVDRWNYYVDGSTPLDDFGFPADRDD